MITEWMAIKHEVEQYAASNKLLPFLGAAISHFYPTSLPMGSGLLHSALQGAFPSLNLFVLPRDKWTYEERQINQHSAEVILQGLAEGLLNREKLAYLYNLMCDLPPNPLHYVMAKAIESGKIPAIFTTNQDRCIEDAATSLLPIYDEDDFEKALHSNLFQFHGAIGGKSPSEADRRRERLNIALNSMGPRLPTRVGSSRWTISNDLSFLNFRLRYGSAFGVKKLMSMIAQLYNDFLMSLFTMIISFYSGIRTMINCIKNERFLYYRKISINQTNADYIRLSALYNET